MGLVESVAAGRREALEAIRDELAGALVEATGRDIAAIARELRATLNDLDKVPDGREVSAVDDLSARRRARRAQASGQ